MICFVGQNRSIVASSQQVGQAGVWLRLSAASDLRGRGSSGLLFSPAVADARSEFGAVQHRHRNARRPSPTITIIDQVAGLALPPQLPRLTSGHSLSAKEA
nr:hypothetical protein BDOA9_0118760 [Bradyrhizobium sp. DOA9]